MGESISSHLQLIKVDITENIFQKSSLWNVRRSLNKWRRDHFTLPNFYFRVNKSSEEHTTEQYP